MYRWKRFHSLLVATNYYRHRILVSVDSRQAGGSNAGNLPEGCHLIGESHSEKIVEDKTKLALLSLSSLNWWPEAVFEGIALPLKVCVAHEDLNQVLRREMKTYFICIPRWLITTPEIVIRQITRMGVVWMESGEGPVRI